MEAASSLSNIDLSKLSDRDKAELQQFIVNESQKSRIQQCDIPSPNTLIYLSSWR